MNLKIYNLFEYTHSAESKRVIEENFIPQRDVKLLLTTIDDRLIETAFYEIIKNNENILHSCISTQIGCKYGCLFCGSGKCRFDRNLSSLEILSEIEHILLYTNYEKLDDISFMGSGEPLDNLTNIVDALRGARERGLFDGTIRFSTIGNIMGIKKLYSLLPNAKLWISLHSANEEKRRVLMPYAKNTAIFELINAAAVFSQKTSQKVVLQYLILKNFNDSEDDAKVLANLLKDKEDSFIIQFALPNGFAIEKWNTRIEDLRNFQQIFSSISSVKSRIFISKGIEVEAGCGELKSLIKLDK